MVRARGKEKPGRGEEVGPEAAAPEDGAPPGSARKQKAGGRVGL